MCGKCIEAVELGTKLVKESNAFDTHEFIETGHENGLLPKLKTSYSKLFS